MFVSTSDIQTRYLEQEKKHVSYKNMVIALFIFSPCRTTLPFNTDLNKIIQQVLRKISIHSIPRCLSIPLPAKLKYDFFKSL